MATLTKSTGTVTLSGTAEKVTLPAAYGWIWVKNMSDADMFAGLSADISEGADGVMVIPSGECGRIQTDGFDFVYLMGTGNVLVVAQNYADCPFKAGVKGGESPDLSEYAKTADVPNIKVNSAVDADTVGEKSADDFPQIIDFGGSQTDTKIAVGKPGKTTIYKCANWTDFPDECTDGQGLLVSVNYSGTGIAGTDSIWAIQLYLSPQTGVVYKRHIAHTSVGNWCAMYSADNKPYISGSATVAANSTTCTSNHGFTPSAVIWWDGNDSGVATWFNETQFAIKITSSVDRTINYLIFK